MIVRARAPLRIGLAGGATDVSPYCDRYGGNVLNATIDKYAYAVLEPTATDRLEFVASDRGKAWSGRASSSIGSECALTLHRAVYNHVVRRFNGGRPLPLRMTTFSDAPAGSGLGASSTLVVAMLAAFSELLALRLGEYELARLAYEIERVDAGLAGGRQDQYAAAFGGFNFIDFHPDERVLVHSLRIKRSFVDELELRSLLCFTGVSRVSARIIEKQQSGVSGGDDAALHALHAVKEQAVAAKEAVLHGDFDALAQALQAGWLAKKRTARGVSNARVDLLLGAALSAGATAAKVSGAGGGGFLYLLVEPTRRSEVICALTDRQGQVMNCHFTEGGARAWRIGR